MSIDTLEVQVAALQRLPETGSESQVGCTVATTVTVATTAPASSRA